MNLQPRFFICAGEASGDVLGAGLIYELKKRYPQAQFIGVCGSHMQAAGCEKLFSINALAVMGIVEILPKLWTILTIRRQVIAYCLQQKIDIFIGIDAPDFNLPVEKKLKLRGIKTVHYVSPTVWAWRRQRIYTVAKAADLLLTLFPFEKAYYAPTTLSVEYVGHRAADSLPQLFASQFAARQALHLNYTENDRLVALLPGSRQSEIKRLGDLFVAVAKRCYQQDKHLKFIIAAANDNIADQMKEKLQNLQINFSCEIVVGKAHAAIKAADVVLLASGTATLETFLLDKPMVVAYRVNAISALLARCLLKTPYCALPNILAGKKIVPEFLQENATIDNLSAAIMDILQHPQKVETLKASYRNMRVDLQQHADEKAARAIAKLLGD